MLCDDVYRLPVLTVIEEICTTIMYIDTTGIYTQVSQYDNDLFHEKILNIESKEKNDSRGC